MNKRTVIIGAAIMAIALSPAWAQDASVGREAPMIRSMENMPMGQEMKPGMDHGTMSESMKDMRQGPEVTNSRDPHAYSDGYTFDNISRPHEADEMNFGMLLVNRFESVRTTNDIAAAYDLQGWFGRDYDRVVLKAEGDVNGGALADARTELLWGHAIATFWDTQLGLRQDGGTAPDRGWLAFGIQGLAPYWFDVEATAYIGDESRTALRVEADYELSFTQKLILQPRLEVNVYGKRDAERARGAGLSDVAAGLRLRYEIRREFAPYIGVEWAGKYGGSASYARAAGQDTKERQAVVGVRFWF